MTPSRRRPLLRKPPLKNRLTGVPAPAAEKKTVDALVDDLVARGADLRAVSLEDMKRRLSAALKTRRPADVCSADVTAAV